MAVHQEGSRHIVSDISSSSLQRQICYPFKTVADSLHYSGSSSFITVIVVSFKLLSYVSYDLVS